MVTSSTHHWPYLYQMQSDFLYFGVVYAGNFFGSFVDVWIEKKSFKWIRFMSSVILWTNPQVFYLSTYLILFHVHVHVSFQISIPLHSHTVLISTSTWRLVGSARFPSSIIFIQLTNELSWFAGQSRNGSIWYVVFLKHVVSSHSATELQQAGVGKLCLLFILKCATKLTGCI